MQERTNMKLKEPFSLYTNLAFLPALYFSYFKGNLPYVLILLSLFIFSTLFHLYKEEGSIDWAQAKGKRHKVLLSIDTTLASILIFYNLFTFYLNNFPPQFWYALPFALIGLYLFIFKSKAKYDKYHGLWHILSGIVTLFAVLS